MEFEFDHNKRVVTLERRGLDMARAGEIFDGPNLSIHDARFDYQETRFITIGRLDERLVVMVWTQREENVRIISLRKANDREHRKYEKRLG